MKKKFRLFLGAILVFSFSSLSGSVTATDVPIVPSFYQQYFTHYANDRTYPEKILNSIGLKDQNLGRSFALIAGISSYPSLPHEQQLNPVTEDIRKLGDYLKNVEFFDEIVVLEDQNMDYENLRFFLQDYFPERLRQFPNSRFLFAYSGHGFSEGRDGYLLLSQAQNSSDKQHSINLLAIRKLLDEVIDPARYTIALINAIRSDAFVENLFETKVKDKGAHIIASGGTFDVHWHDPEIGVGSVFFEKFFDGLNGSADINGNRGDGIISAGVHSQSVA